eukprot:scaffold44800_cov23-Prasinocladus_malaysianus.AAC.1
MYQRRHDAARQLPPTPSPDTPPQSPGGLAAKRPRLCGNSVPTQDSDTLSTNSEDVFNVESVLADAASATAAGTSATPASASTHGEYKTLPQQMPIQRLQLAFSLPATWSPTQGLLCRHVSHLVVAIFSSFPAKKRETPQPRLG